MPKSKLRKNHKNKSKAFSDELKAKKRKGLEEHKELFLRNLALVAESKKAQNKDNVVEVDKTENSEFAL